MRWHGAQRGVVALAERQLRVQRPRLRDKNGREVNVPAYERLRDDANVGARVRDILVAGVSTRRYAAVLPEAAGTVGVSKSSVSRRFIEASAAQLAALNERSLADLPVLVIYVLGYAIGRFWTSGWPRISGGRRNRSAPFATRMRGSSRPGFRTRPPR